jgi:hypothetical protein
MFGTNFVWGVNLRINYYSFIETLSIGDCHIDGTFLARLDYNLWRSGNIYYRGTPLEIRNFSDGTAKGQLIKE